MPNVFACVKSNVLSPDVWTSYWFFFLSAVLVSVRSASPQPTTTPGKS